MPSSYSQIQSQCNWVCFLLGLVLEAVRPVYGLYFWEEILISASYLQLLELWNLLVCIYFIDIFCERLIHYRNFKLETLK